MNAKQICKALLEGKKVGMNDSCYIYLNIDGELQIENYFGGDTLEEQVGEIWLSPYSKILPEEGP